MKHYTSAPTVLVTGANGQLGQELRQLSSRYPSYRFLFAARQELPIDDFEITKKYFEANPVDYCVNCAAYTAVDKAETESAKAYLINSSAVANLAQLCNLHQARFIHISTDYVFNGRGISPYQEDDACAPINVYGASKLNGEELALSNDPSALIIRTSWVFSAFGNNFVKTMVRLLGERENLNVVNDQQGCPSYAGDIAEAILKIIDHSKRGWIPGIFNYCNEGVTTWYHFALSIRDIVKSKCTIHPVASADYKALAPRPLYSVLDTGKIRRSFDLSIPHWKDGLQKCLLQL